MIDENINDKLDRIELLLNSLLKNKLEKDYYSTSEVAERLGKAEFAIREWCRLRRVLATKRKCVAVLQKNGLSRKKRS